MSVITALLFFFSGLFGGYSLLPRQIYSVSKEMTWTDAQSYCRLKYTDLPFVYSEEDLDKIKASTPLYKHVIAWLGEGNMNSDSQNTTESDQTPTQKCLAIDTLLWKLVKRDCKLLYPFYCSQREGKSAVLRIKVNPGGQLDLEDPGIRSNMLAKINEKFNKIGFGDAIKIRWITKRETVGENRANDTCDTQ